MPQPIRWPKLGGCWPGAKRTGSEQPDKLVTVHRHIARPRRNGPRVDAWMAAKQSRGIATHAIHDLPDLVERAGTWTSQVEHTTLLAGQETLKDGIQVVAIGARTNLVEVEGRRPTSA